jgi:hypothetical protein
MGGNEPVGTGPGVIIAPGAVGVGGAPAAAFFEPPPDPEQAYAVNAITMSGIPSRSTRRRQYTEGGRGPTGRRNDATEGHPMTSSKASGALAPKSVLTMRR